VRSEKTKKKPDEMEIPDQGELVDKFPRNWAVILDKAFTGEEKEIRAIIPSKVPNPSPTEEYGLQKKYEK